MDNINYEQEVKKVYPDAYGQYFKLGRQYHTIVSGENATNDSDVISEICDSEESAWESAYNTITSPKTKPNE